MTNILSALTILIPSIGILSGLSSSITISLFLIFMMIKFGKNLSLELNQLKLEIVFAIWCLISCLWSINFQTSILTLCQVFTLVAAGLFLNNSISLKKINFGYFRKSLNIGIIAAMLLFFLEYYTQGIIYENFRYIFQIKDPVLFSLHKLDRGCALLSLASWILIGSLIHRKQTLLATLLYLVIFYILYLSDSLASLVGFFIAGGLFLSGNLIWKGFFKFTTFVLIIGSLIMPIFSYNINPNEISNQYQTILPDSAKHRLFIWNYVSEKITIKPISGWGFASSKRFSASSEEMVRYKDYYWSPFPLHPHNNILQVLFETGIFGLSIFLLIVYKYLRKIEGVIARHQDVGSIVYVCFINYYIIGMISFSIWQTWWVASGVWLALMMKTLIVESRESSR